MKYTKHTLLIAFAIFIPSLYGQLVADVGPDDRDTFGRSYFHARSQGSNTAIQSVHIPRFLFESECGFNSIPQVIPGYSSSFDRDAIGTYFFFNGTSTMKTGTAAGPGVDIFAQNFLLDNNYDGAITGKPRATNITIDLGEWFTFSTGCLNWYGFIFAPVVWTKWKVDFDEDIQSVGTIIPANSLGNPNDEAAPYTSMAAAWSGQETFFDVSQPLKFARIDGGQTTQGIADVNAALGYVFINTDCSFLGIDLRAIFPTGTRPNGEFVFEPTIGNGHHYEVGAGIVANLELWNNCFDQSLNIFFNAAGYHMFGSKQKRTFDLSNNGTGSRYLLFKRFVNNVYAGEIVRGPNILTLDCEVSNAIHGDGTIMLDFIIGNWTVDMGYNIWGRSKDEITLKGTVPDRTYGIAGTTGTAAGINQTASDTVISGENANDADLSPVFITTSDIDIESAQNPGTASHSLFGYAGYSWNCAVQPFVGLGLQLEFSGMDNNAFRMWHIWAKTGFSLF